MAKPTNESDPYEEYTKAVTNVILTSNVNYLLETTKTVQALAVLLFSTYLAWLYRVADNMVPPLLGWHVLLLPALSWGVAIISVFLNTIVASFRGKNFNVGHLESTVAAYEEVLRQRRRIVLIPTILLVLGLAICGYIVWAQA